ncbi:MAG: methylated-DNA--[protein]-cysteine S-methyltransferase [Desulfuromonadaceae bacterium]|nr:methylated-DNA--[protein]-cysteine S-methyltransferase [Desulfuromonadaceae bacterium]
MYSSNFMTGYGYGTVYANDRGILKVEIPDLSLPETAHQEFLPKYEPSEMTIQAAQMLQRYFDGERIEFSGIPVVLDCMTPFRRNILDITRRLTYGEICTYGRIACECGSPRAARAVGGALASNPVPIIIPCHRVVASDGRLTGFSAPGGENTKMALLKMEGIEFRGLLVSEKQMIMHRTLKQ